MALSALEKLKLTGQLSAALAELNLATKAIEKVKSAKAVIDILALLGADQVVAPDAPDAITQDQKKLLLKELNRLLDSGDWGDSSRYNQFSKRIFRAADGSKDDMLWAKKWLADLEGLAQDKPEPTQLENSLAKSRQEDAAADLLLGKSDNPYYQAYLDTLESEDLAEGGKSYNYMAFMSKMTNEFEKTFTGQVTGNNGYKSDEYNQDKEQFIRRWSEQNLSDRVKSSRVNEVSEVSEVAPAPADLSAIVSEPEPAIVDEQAQLKIVEYTTKRGKLLRGVIRTDLTYAQAKAIDEYSFKLNGGWFIRERHLSDLPVSAGDPVKVASNQPIARPEPTEDEIRAKELEARKEKSQKLLDAGQKVIDKADSVIGQSRLTNTARRASMAAGISEREEKNRTYGVTMQNIANAIMDGETKYMTGITAKSQLESLERILLMGRHNRFKDRYDERRKYDGLPYEQADIDNATFPQVKLRSFSQFVRTVEEKAIRGYKKFLNESQFWGERPLTLDQYDQIVKFTDGDSMVVDWVMTDNVDSIKRLKKLGINNNDQLREALAEYNQYRGEKRKENPVKALERAIIGMKVGLDFFPTPTAQSQKMVALANVKQGDRVLEPSAGNGNIADAAAAAGAAVDVIEISSQLQEILKAKGHNLVDTNFDNFTPDEPYDAILMNPPWSNNLDIQHVTKAYGMLKNGGTLVAIMGEGAFFREGKQETAFREWLGSVGGYDEKLPEKTFMDKSLLATTSANGRMIVIHK